MVKSGLCGSVSRLEFLYFSKSYGNHLYYDFFVDSMLILMAWEGHLSMGDQTRPDRTGCKTIYLFPKIFPILFYIIVNDQITFV